MKGPKHKPTQLKILRMTAKRADALIKKQHKTTGPLTDPPAWLTAEQKEEWAYAIDNAPREVLKRCDKSVLAGFIMAQDIHRKASQQLNELEALLVKSPVKGAAIQNPYLAIVNRQMLLMIRAASELGFTPCSRARIDSGNIPAAADPAWEDISA